MKKAQIESMGLVIIVILLVFIAMFALPFIIEEKSESLDNNYLQLVSNNLRSVVLNTNICSLASVKDEVLSCEVDMPICLSDCGEINEVIRNIIENSLGDLKSKVDYKFRAGDIMVSDGDCAEVISSSKAFIDEIEVVMELCYRR